MRRILILTPRYPYPVVGGDRLRIYQVCKALSKHFSLTLLSLCESKQELESALPTDGVFDSIERVYLSKWQSRFNAFTALFGKVPLQVAYYRSKLFGEKICQILPSCDACLAHLIRTGDYVRGDVGCFRVLEMTDAISLNYHRVRALGQQRGAKSLIYRIEADRLLSYEREILRDFDIVSLVSKIDRDFLIADQSAGNVIVCSNGVEFSQLPYSERPITKRKVIAFIGNVTSLQNLDACLHFVEDVLPVLRPSLEVVFRVVGRINDADAARLRRHPGVEVTGQIDSIPCAVADAWIGVCPVRIGAGVQNKVLEYLALGLPAITSSLGLEGLSARVGVDLLVADSPGDYLEQIRMLISDVEFGRALARNGRKYVESNHDWGDQLAPLVEAVKLGLRVKSVDPSKSRG